MIYIKVFVAKKFNNQSHSHNLYRWPLEPACNMWLLPTPLHYVDLKFECSLLLARLVQCSVGMEQGKARIYYIAVTLKHIWYSLNFMALTAKNNYRLSRESTFAFPRLIDRASAKIKQRTLGSIFTLRARFQGDITHIRWINIILCKNDTWVLARSN